VIKLINEENLKKFLKKWTVPMVSATESEEAMYQHERDLELCFE